MITRPVPWVYGHAMTSPGEAPPGVVVGVSTSATGASALDWALRQAALRGLPVTAVRAWDLPTYGAAYAVDDALRSLEPEHHRAELDLARQALGDAVARVPEAAGLDVRAVTAMGRPASVLLEAARGAALVVVGARGVGALSRLVLLGSVTSAVLHHARGPVAVVPEALGPPAAGPVRVLVGVDGSAPSRAALRWAVAQARLQESVLVPVAVRAPGRPAAPDDDALDDLVAAAREAGADTPVSPQVRHGHPAEQLLALAEQADLLVLGSRGRGGFSRMLVGSTSTACAAHTSCPLVVVRA